MHTLPPLPYYHASLEPHIDAHTMTLHHDRHHASYVANLNAALKDCAELHERTALWLLLNLDKVPRQIRTAVRNNAGGHVNHGLFWRAMAPGGRGTPSGAFAAAINRDFGSFESFKARFEEAGGQLLGSGWIWLTRTQQDGGRLQIATTSGHDNPQMDGRFPILVNDVWEHAYYLKHEERRGDYLRGWWQVVNWAEAARRFESAGCSDGPDREDEGGSLLTAAA